MDDKETAKKHIRVYLDGCFDCFHFAHANALIQARELGDALIAGVHSDGDITKHKGRSPVCSEAERYRLLRAIKWVDEVVEASSFLPDVELLDRLNCDFCVHGDDKSCNADGSDSYRFLKAAGRYKEIKRTPGISTTDIIKRLLIATEDRICATSKDDFSESKSSEPIQGPMEEASGRLGISSGSNHLSENCLMSKFLAKFASKVERKDGDRAVYVAGDFDLFNEWHLELLEKARLHGDHLIVGVHSDEDVKTYRGDRFPILTLFERVLTLVAFRCVSEVIVGAPVVVTEELIKRFRVDAVCQEKSENPSKSPVPLLPQSCQDERNFELIEISVDVENFPIAERIKRNRVAYEKLYGSPDAIS